MSNSFVVVLNNWVGSGVPMNQSSAASKETQQILAEVADILWAVALSLGRCWSLCWCGAAFWALVLAAYLCFNE